MQALNVHDVALGGLSSYGIGARIFARSSRSEQPQSRPRHPSSTDACGSQPAHVPKWAA